MNQPAYVCCLNPQDVCHKLVHLAWNDWSPEVRSGASQALGKTGHGKVLYTAQQELRLCGCNVLMPAKFGAYNFGPV